MEIKFTTAFFWMVSLIVITTSIWSITISLQHIRKEGITVHVVQGEVK